MTYHVLFDVFSWTDLRKSTKKSSHFTLISAAHRNIYNGITPRAISQIYSTRFLHIVTKYLTLSRRKAFYERCAQFVCPAKFTKTRG